MELRPGDRFGRYRVVRLLGRGGMGAVHEAVDEAIGRGVALKVLSADLARDPAALERFRREARAAGAINDPRVVTLLGVETAGPRVALVFELVPGGSLEELRVRAGGRLAWREAARLGAELARGLAVIHRAGLVHRDVKPHNALLDAAGRLKVSDLGLVRADQVSRSSLSATGELVGTYRYLAPEAQEEAPVGPPADVYALGVTLYQLLAGRPPFEGEGFAALKQHAFDPPPPLAPLAPGTPPALEALVLRLLDKAPGRRGAAADVALELEALRRPPRDRRRRRGGLWNALAACGLGLALGVVVVAGRDRAPVATPGPPPAAAPGPPPPPPPALPEPGLAIVAQGRVEHPVAPDARPVPFPALTLTFDARHLVLGGGPGRYESFLVDAETLTPVGPAFPLAAAVADPIRPKLVGFTPASELVRVPLDDPRAQAPRRERFEGAGERGRFVGASIAIDRSGDVLYAAFECGPPDPVDVYELEFRRFLRTVALDGMSVGRVLASPGGRAYLAFHRGDRRERDYELVELKRHETLRQLGRCSPLAATPSGDLVVLAEFEGQAPKRLLGVAPDQAPRPLPGVFEGNGTIAALGDGRFVAGGAGVLHLQEEGRGSIAVLRLAPTANGEALPRAIIHDRTRGRLVVAIDDPYGWATRLVAVEVRGLPR